MNWSGSYFSESRCPFRRSNTLAGMQGIPPQRADSLAGMQGCRASASVKMEARRMEARHDGSEADGGEVTQVCLGMELVWDRRLHWAD
jgi:hypothetical protein